MTAPTVVHHDTTVTERAVLCADGRVHYGPEYLRGMDPVRVRGVADQASLTWCGGGPHVIATRERITTAWKPSP